MTQNMRQDFPIESNGIQSYTNGTSQIPQKNGYHEQTNGHDPSTNGVSRVNTNGYSGGKSRPRLRNYFGHDREEVTRLLMQGLEDLGYTEAANQLSRESGYQVESPAIATFRHALLDGEWSGAETILFGEAFDPEEGGVSINGKALNGQTGLELVENADPLQLKFLIREQKYIELLRNNRRGEALTVLQSELQPLKHDNQRLNILSGLLVSDPSRDQNWDTLLESRQKLLTELSKYISPSAMIPQHRLADLLNQVHSSQIYKCVFHNPPTNRPASLFVDHQCDQTDFPTRNFIELSQNDGEVWFVDFSHNGKFLAACGDSRAVVIYDMQTFEVRYKLLDHGKEVIFVSWSPDDSKLITCCKDARARVWDMTVRSQVHVEKTGRCLQTIDHHGQWLTSAAWSPDSNTIVTGSSDRQGQLCMRSLDGSESYDWLTVLRTQDCVITPDGRKLIVLSIESHITVYDMETKAEDYAIKTGQRTTCITVSRDSKQMLINMANGEIHLIDIETAEIVKKFEGPHQDLNVIRSTFGGTDQGLILSGSTDSKIYIWHKYNGTLIETLEGHATGCVNSVAWNPTHPTMFASGGDDKKVRLWTKETRPSRLPRRRLSTPVTHRHSL